MLQSRFFDGSTHQARAKRCTLFGVLALTACSQTLVTAPNPIEIDPVEYTRIYKAAMEVLREYGFSIDRHSHRYGVITTKYLNSPTVFEPWHTSNTTNQQAWESTFNQQRRLVTVSLEPINTPPPTRNPFTTPDDTDASPGYRLRVEVFIERFQHPYRHMNGSTSGHRINASLRTIPTELSDRGIQKTYWRPLGRDPYLEQRLLAQIIRRSFKIEPSPAI